MKSTSLIVILLLFQACESSKVIKFLNDELDYSQYHTFSLIHYKSDDKSYDDEGLAFFTNIEKAIDDNLTKKGYVVAERPDLIARYELISTTVSSQRNRQSYDPYGYNSSYNVPTNWTAKQSTEGLILIELRDRKQKKLVWQGSLDLEYTSKKDHHTTLAESIDQIFSSYPYQAGSNEPLISE